MATYTPKPSKKSNRRPAHEVLMEFMKKEKMDFVVRRQQVRYLDDNSMLVERPTITVFYLDELEEAKKTNLSN